MATNPQDGTNLQDGKTGKKSTGEHGGNRGGDRDRKDRPQRSSQAAGKDPRRGEKDRSQAGRE